MFALLGACSSNAGGDESIDIVHDVCTPLAVSAVTASEAQADGITRALGLWDARGAPYLGAVEPGALRAAGEARIEIRFERAAQAFYGLYDDETGVIYINSGITDPAALSIVIAHELGHAFGLPHVTERSSLMNPGNHQLPPTAEDQAALQALWGDCVSTP